MAHTHSATHPSKSTRVPSKILHSSTKNSRRLSCETIICQHPPLAGEASRLTAHDLAEPVVLTTPPSSVCQRRQLSDAPRQLRLGARRWRRGERDVRGQLQEVVERQQAVRDRADEGSAHVPAARPGWRTGADQRVRPDRQQHRLVDAQRSVCTTPPRVNRNPANLQSHRAVSSR